MTIDLAISCPVYDSFRVQQVLGMFDMPRRDRLGQRFTVELPDLSDPWQIGAIVGPSGSGKTTIAREAFGRNLYTPGPWPADCATIDCFGDLPIRNIVQTLTAVGFSSPPSWIKPLAVLSNGEKFRCELARALLGDRTEDLGLRTESGEKTKLREGLRQPGPKSLVISPIPVVFDEFTSVVDRTVARIGSAAVSRAIRSGKIPRRFVAVTCHYDVIPWLAPDWVLDMATGVLSRRWLRRSARLAALAQGRPSIRLRIRRADRSAWAIFQRHHYLSGNLHPSAQCFVGYVGDRPAAFTAVLPFPHPIRPGWREHRTVCLPDFQGVGIGSTMSAYIASLYVATKKPYFSTSSHPAVIHHRAASADWKMLRKPGMVSAMGASGTGKTHMGDTVSRCRLTAGFEYVGPGRDAEARAMGLVRA